MDVPIGTLNHPIINIPLPNGLVTRGITKDTCKLFKVYSSTEPLCVVIHYQTHDEPTPCGYKHRKGGWTHGIKEVRWEKGSTRCLFGLHLWDGGECAVYLCEGETDAMSLYRHLMGKGEAPFLVLALGGNPPDNLLPQWIDLIYSITGRGNYPLITVFDNDKPGHGYYDLIEDNYPDTPHKLIIPSQYKDICEALMGGETTFTTKGYEPPANLITGAALLDDTPTQGKEVLTTGFPNLDALIGGYRGGSMLMFTGLSKAGKSTFVAGLTTNYISNHSHLGKVLYMPLELKHGDTLYMMASQYSPEDIDGGRSYLAEHTVMLKHFGYAELPLLDSTLKAIPKMGISLLVIDHITAACTGMEGLATKLLDAALSLIQTRLLEYNIPAIVVTHVNAGGAMSDTISSQHLRGSQSLSQLPSCVLAVRRADDGITEVYSVTPDRYTGRVGRMFFEWTGKFEPMKTKGGL